jgi:hypothetical protein
MPPITHKFRKLKARLKEAAKEAGNVLFMILIAVALFAALAYAVTGSTRSTGADASRETNTVIASQIIQYSTTIKSSVMRMQLSNSCLDTQISFENALISGYTNPNAPATNICHIFLPSGGAVVFQPPPLPITTPYIFSGQNGFRQHSGLENNSDLAIILPDIPNDICIEINRKLFGNASIPTKELTGQAVSVTKFIGAYDPMGSYNSFTGGSAWADRKYPLCFYSTAGNKNFFVDILLPR